MTKSVLRKFIGKLVLLKWRDPQGDSGWSTTPLESKTYPTETSGTLLGFNSLREAIIGCTHGGVDNKEWGDRTAIPLNLIYGVALLQIGEWTNS